MSTYIVFGVELVYDAFDDYEHANPQGPFSVEANSIDEAKRKGQEKISYYIQETRKGFFHSGYFEPCVIQIADESGYLVYDESEHLVRSWPNKSDEKSLIPSNGLPTRVCFLAYNNRDRQFAEVLNAHLRTRDYVTWFAPERPDMPKPRSKKNEMLKSLIAEGIRSSRIVLTTISNHSVTSDWVAFETLTAIEHEGSFGRPLIIGLQIEPEVSHVEWLSQLCTRYPIFDLTHWHDKARLEEQIEALANYMDKIFDSFSEQKND